MKNLPLIAFLLFLLPAFAFAEEAQPKEPFEIQDDFKALNEIDGVVLADLQKKGIQPAFLSSDPVFLRRVYLDVTGKIPTVEEAREFLKNESPTKRAELIDRLLDSPQYADYWTMRWADFLRVKAEFPINLWPHATAVYFRWIHEQIDQNTPYDVLARDLLMGQGSCFRAPCANFYRAVERKEPVELASVAVLTFLGERTDLWPEAKRNDVTKFFTRVAFKGSAQWKEEIVYWDSKPLDSPEVVFPDGSKGTVGPGQDPREVFMNWLVRPENHAFNQQIVNRLWFWLMGVGIIDPPDDLRQMFAGAQPPAYPGGGNPPINAELLNVLEKKLVETHYDLKAVMKFILNSRTYQQSSIPRETAENAEKAVRNLAVYPVRRIDAEVLQDVFIDVFNTKIKYVSEVPEPFSYVPEGVRTVQLYDSGLTNPFLEMFGRSTRDSGMTTDRNRSVNEAQQMFLMNSNEVNTWMLQNVQNRIRELDKIKTRLPEQFAKGARNLAETLWLKFLSRHPTEPEIEAFTEVLRSRDSNDAVWFLVNSREFLCLH
ncbi:MAG: DUF1553 domain-containing protein [Thermoguttaceae bacterium]|nr:DUF1553 domain-containing protein [Thermoguttaceae bacterium]MBR0192008.1 DUF1553 domain-containing protein [Thermoguttaceae bacterium]